MALRHDFMCLFFHFLLLLVVFQGCEGLSCVNGKEEQGKCQCKPCWKGSSCDQIDNKHRPIFDDAIQYVSSMSGTEGDLVYMAIADDDDNELTCKGECPCGNVEYSIVSGDKDVFRIESSNGKIRLKKELTRNHSLIIQAKNPYDSENYSRMTLEVKLKNGNQRLTYSQTENSGYVEYQQQDEPHNRVRRAAADTPSNVTFNLTKNAIHDGITEIRAGQRIGFRLEIDFPAGTTDMLVELFAPDNGSMVMMLCDVQVESVGSNLQYTGSADVKYFSKNNSIFYDWAVIDLGNVTNDNNNDGQHQIVIVYNAVMIQNDGTVDGNTYWVSAGAEYNSENEVWVGQAQFTAKLDDNWDINTNKPVFNFSGPSTMEIGSAAVFTVDMYITYPSIGLSFDAFAPLNNTSIMTICGIEIEGVGSNYQCGFDYTQVPSSLHKDGQLKGNARGRLDIGVATNKGVRDSNNPMEANLMRVHFLAKVWDDPSLIGTGNMLGAALELGSDQIWCGQIEVNIVAKTNTSLPTPTITTQFIGNTTEVSETQPVILEITAELREGNGDFTLELESELDGSSNPMFQICALALMSSGENIPCINEDKKAVLSTIGNDKSITDKAVLDLGTVTNVGSWGYFNHSRNDTRDKVVFRALVKGTKYTTGTNNLKINFATGGAASTNIHNEPIVTASSGSVPDMTDTVPMNVSYKTSDGNVRVNEAVTMEFKITSLKGQTFPMFDLEFIAPNSSDSAIVSICRAEVISVGKNLPCLNKDNINSQWTYMSQFGDNKTDRAALSLGAVPNFAVDPSGDEDDFVLSSVFQLQPHASATPGTQMYLSSGIMYSPSRMWVGQLSLTVDGSTLPGPSVPEQPVIYVTKVGDFDVADTPVGYPARYEIAIKTKPGVTLDLTVTISTSQTTLSLCSLRIKDVGRNMPCMDKTTKATVTKDEATGMNNQVILKPGYVTNVGDVPSASSNSSFDDNTILLEVTMQSNAAATPGNLQFTVDVDGSGVAITTPPQNLVITSSTAGISTNVSNSSSIDFNVAAVASGDDDLNVTPGQAKRFFIDVNIPMNGVTKVTVKLMTAVESFGQFEVVYIGLVESGENLACLTREMTSTSYSTRAGPYIDTGTMETGFVCNTGINTDDPLANRIRVEAYARLLNNDTLSNGDIVKLNAAVNFNDQQIFIAQKDLTVSSTFTDIVVSPGDLSNDTAITVNSTSSPITMKIGQVATIPVVLYIPPYTISNVLFDIDLPTVTGSSASMTFKEVRFVGAGRNLAKYGYPLDYKVTPASSLGTTQMNKVSIDLRVVSNIGVTHRTNTSDPDDDRLYLEVDVQMADSTANVHNADLWVSFGVKVGGIIMVLDNRVQVIRDGTEQPVFNLIANYVYENSTSTYAEINVKLTHDNASTAEYQNTVLKANVPPYLTYKDMQSKGPTTPSSANVINQNEIEVDLGSFYFTDELDLTLSFEVNGTYEVPQGILTTASVSGVEVIANMIERTNPAFRNGSEDFTSGFIAINGTYTTTSASSSSASCTPAVLADVQACHFSSSGGDISAPSNAEYSGTGWKPPVRDGKLGQQRYLQVTFGRETTVTRIHYTHLDTVNYINKIKLHYSDDSLSWIVGEELSLGAGPTADVQVNGGKKFTYLRLYIISTSTLNTEVGIKVQFEGCYIASTPSPVPCPTPSSTPPADFAVRSFVTDANNVYVCDGTVGKKNNIELLCFSSPDGSKWTALDERLACMVGFHDDVKGARLYGLTKDYNYLTSNDDGVTWMSVSPSRVSTIKAAGTFRPAIKVPWTADAQLFSGTDVVQFTQGTWTAKYQGLGTAGTFVNKFKWDTCC